MITDIHRELCGDNRDCLFDFAATNDTDLAMNTLQFSENTGNLQTMLGKTNVCIADNIIIVFYILSLRTKPWSQV